MKWEPTRRAAEGHKAGRLPVYAPAGFPAVLFRAVVLCFQIGHEQKPQAGNQFSDFGRNRREGIVEPPFQIALGERQSGEVAEGMTDRHHLSVALGEKDVDGNLVIG